MVKDLSESSETTRSLEDLKTKLYRSLDEMVDFAPNDAARQSRSARKVTPLLLIRLNGLEDALRAIQEGNGRCTLCSAATPLEALEVACEQVTENRGGPSGAKQFVRPQMAGSSAEIKRARTNPV